MKVTIYESLTSISRLTAGRSSRGASADRRVVRVDDGALINPLAQVRRGGHLRGHRAAPQDRSAPRPS